MVGKALSGVSLGLLLAVEGDEDEAEGVEGGEEGTTQTGPQQGALATGLHLPEDGVFTVETGGHQWQRGQGRAPHQEAGIDQRQRFAQASHLEDVLLVVGRD